MYLCGGQVGVPAGVWGAPLLEAAAAPVAGGPHNAADDSCRSDRVGFMYSLPPAPCSQFNAKLNLNVERRCGTCDCVLQAGVASKQGRP